MNRRPFLKKVVNFTGAALTTLGLCSCQSGPNNLPKADCLPSDQLSMSRLQYVGSHNSYHIAPKKEAFDWLSSIDPEKGKRNKRTLGYTHTTIGAQLNAGQRMLELDVYADPNGGRFNANKLKEITRSTVASNEILSYDDSLLKKPGLKTIHYPNFDLDSHCPIFLDCLVQIKNWHVKNPQHLPLLVLLEVKEGRLFDMQDSLAEPSHFIFGNREWNELQNSILDVFGSESLIFPKDVSSDTGQIEWPAIKDSKGKVAFLLFDYGKSVSQRYADFSEQTKQAAVLHLQKGTKTFPASWARQSVPNTNATLKAQERGLIVYSKADTTGLIDKGRRMEALASGANLVATDYTDEFSQKVRIRRQCM